VTLEKSEAWMDGGRQKEGEEARDSDIMRDEERKKEGM